MWLCLYEDYQLSNLQQRKVRKKTKPGSPQKDWRSVLPAPVQAGPVHEKDAHIPPLWVSTPAQRAERKEICDCFGIDVWTKESR